MCRESLSLLDGACDQIGKRFLSDRQPPAPSPAEVALTSEGRAAQDCAGGGRAIWPDTLCRLARPTIARLCVEGDKAVLYHCADNAREYRS